MEYKNSCFVFWWLITLYFNTMYVCFCGALVVNKLFQFHVNVFFPAVALWLSPENTSKAVAMTSSWKSQTIFMMVHFYCGCLFVFFPLQDPHFRNVTLYSLRARTYLSRTEESPVQSFYSLVSCSLVIVWNFVSIQLDCLPEKMQRDAWPMLWLSGSMSCQPQSQKNWSRRHPCSPITWAVAAPARYNKSHVLFGVGLWELLLLSAFHPYHCTKKSYFHTFPWLFPARLDFANALPNS